MPPELRWPKERLVSAAPWAVAVGVLGVVVSVLLAGVSQIPLSSRILLIAGTLVLAALICAGIVLGKRALVMWRRARSFDSLQQSLSQTTSAYEKVDVERNTLHAQVDFLVQALAASGSVSFPVEGAISRMGTAALILSSFPFETGGVRKLSIGDRIVVVNIQSWATLGLFEVYDQDRQGLCYAREVTISDSLWWGKIHADLTPHQPTRVHAAALLVGPKDRRP